jgi:sarcosine oxidase
MAIRSRAIWREWEERFGRELVSSDGAVALGPPAQRRLAVLEAAGVGARAIGAAELADRLPILAPYEGSAMLDADGGVIRARAAIDALAGALRERLVHDEVLAARPTGHDTVEVRTGGRAAEHSRVVVCAGRGSAELARGAGLRLPVTESVHVRLAFPVRGLAAPASPRGRSLACLQDGEAGAYGDPLPGNAAFAVGLGEAAPAGLAALAGRVAAYASRALPGLDTTAPCDVRHCWVTRLPWGADGIAVWELGGLLVLAGSNLFKHAPAVGRDLAAAALGDGLPERLRPEARLGG